MRTDRHVIAALLRQLRDYLQRVTDQADSESREAGLSVEVLSGGVRRYRDTRLDQLAARRTARRPLPYVQVRSGELRSGEPVEVGARSAPTLVATTSGEWLQ